jgi:hypothetical protein
MDRSNATFSIERLKTEERGHRSRVDREPLDMHSRMSLAWCLFIQAMHQAGRENLLSVLRESGAVDEMPREKTLRLDRDAQHLLRECLKQLCAVCELSRNPNDLSEVERLRYLVTASGAEAALRETDDEASRWMAEMARAVVAGPIVERTRGRRRRIARPAS